MLRRTIIFLAICAATTVNAQIDTSGNPRPGLKRHYAALKWNVALMGMFVGTEVLGTYAPTRHIQVQASYRIYEVLLSGISGRRPHRAAWDTYIDVYYHIPITNTFSGWSVGPYYNFGGGTLSYKQVSGSTGIKYYDRFDFKRQTIGLNNSFAWCLGLKRRFLLEVYIGVGYNVHLELNRHPVTYPFMTDHTEMARSAAKTAGRGGLCIGYIFL